MTTLPRKPNDCGEEYGPLAEQNKELEAKLNELLNERDAIQLKVEAMLEAMTIIDPEVAEAVGR